MKNKMIKIWGIVLTIAILAGLLIIQAVPASASNLIWSKQSIPAVIPFNILTPNTGSWVMDVAPDGQTIFAYDNMNHLLYKSTNAGATFSSTGIGTGIESTDTPTPFTGTIVALAVSSNYAADSLVVAATTTSLYASSNAGGTFSMAATVGSTPGFGYDGGSVITSVDAGLSYTGAIAIIVGWSEAGHAGASLFGSGGLGGSWTSLALTGTSDKVIGVALSPMYSTDATLLMVSANGTGVFVNSKVGNLNVNQLYPAAKIGTLTSADVNMASIAFSADFSTSGANSLFVGLDNTTVPVSRVTLGIGTASAMTGAPSSAVSSLAFKGNLADGYLYVGLSAGGPVWRATGVLSNTATFSPSLKSPAGNGVIVRASPVASDTNVFAITNSNANSALYVSTDGAINFNQLSLINIGSTSVTSINDFVTADTNNMFMILTDSNGTTRIFKTTNGGASWLGTLWTTGLSKIYLSPAFATDSTVYATTLTSVWKSSNAGMNFSLIPFLASNVTAFAPVDGNTFYYGAANSVYKSGFIATPATVGGTVTAIDYVDASNLFVGTSSGSVYISTNGGSSFVPLGATPFGSITAIQADVNYATNNVIYAADATTIKSFTVGTSTDWGNTAAVAGVNELAQGSEGTMYASSSTVDAAVYRSVNPGLTAVPGYGYYDMATGLAGEPAGTYTTSVSVLATGTPTVANNTIYAVFHVAGSADTVYTIQDTLVVAPTVTAPADKSSQAQPLTLTWTPIPAVAGVQYTYKVTIATDTAYAGVVNSGSTGASSYYLAAGSLTPGTTYYWKVQVTAPLYSKSSLTRSFTVKLNQYDNVLTLNSPTAGELGVALNPTFEWTGINGATGYDFQVSDNPVFVNPIDSQTNLITTVWTETTTLDYAKVYYWRVRAVNSNTGVTGDWVQGSFTTMQKPVPTTSTTVAPPATTTVTITPSFPPITVTMPSTTPTTPATPAYIWVIIVIGAVLVIAVIVLIARTRRV